MNIAAITRLVVYLAGLGASILALAGYATFDHDTGELDILPFNVSVAATWVVTALSSGLSIIALVRGWSK